MSILNRPKEWILLAHCGKRARDAEIERERERWDKEVNITVESRCDAADPLFCLMLLLPIVRFECEFSINE